MPAGDWNPVAEKKRIDQKIEQLMSLPEEPTSALVSLLAQSQREKAQEGLGSAQKWVESTLESEEGAQHLLRVCAGSHEQTSRLVHLDARSRYAGQATAPIRTLQNLNLLKLAGLDFLTSNPGRLAEFGPGKTGIYSFGLSLGWAARVLDKNPSLRYLAVARGAEATYEAELGRTGLETVLSVGEGEHKLDLLIGIGLLNVFSFGTSQEYEETVRVLSSIISDGARGVWLTYDQPSVIAASNVQSVTSTVKGGVKIRDAVWESHGWTRVEIPYDLTSAQLFSLGLNFRHGAEFSLWTKGF